MATEQLGIVVKAVDQATATLGKIERSLNNMNAHVGKLTRGFGMLSSLIQGIGQGIGQAVFRQFELILYRLTRVIPDLIGKGEEWAKTVDDIGDKTGIAAEQASKLAAAAKYVNVSTDALTLGLVRLSRNVIDNEKQFTRFGIATRDSNGNLLNAYDIFQNLRHAISATGGSMLSTAAAQNLLGRGGAELSDLLQLTDAQFQALTADAQKSGLIMSESARRAAEEWERTKGRLDSTITGLGTQILGGVAPYLSQLVDSISNAIQQNMGQIVQFVVQVVNFIGGLIAGLFGLTLPTVTFAHALGNVGNGANSAADGLQNLNDKAGKTATGEDRLTKSLNRQIDAIDRQLKAMGRRDDAQNAAEERQKILDDLASAQQQLADVQDQTIFAAGMTEAERVLAEQKHAQDVIDAQKNVSDVRQRLADHDRQEAQRQRRQQLEDERSALQDRLSAHRKFVSQLKNIYKPLQQPNNLANFGKTISSFSTFGGNGGGLTGAISQAAADARAAGQQMADNVRDFGNKVGEFVTWAKGVIDKLSTGVLGPGTPSIVDLGIGAILFKAFGGGAVASLVLRALGMGGAAPSAAATIGAGSGLTGVAATISTAIARLGLAGWIVGMITGGPGFVSGAGNDPNAPPNKIDPNTGRVVPYFGKNEGEAGGAAPNISSTTGFNLDAVTTPLSTIATAVSPGGSLYQNLYNGTGAQQEAAQNTGDTADRTQGLTDQLGAGINTSVVNTPNVNSAVTNKPTVLQGDQQWKIDPVTGAKILVNNPALTAMRFANGKLSTTTVAGKQPGCFVAGTMVDTPDGGKPIESLQIGDAVYAVDESLQLVVSKVIDLLPHPSHTEPRLLVQFANGEWVEVTTSHRFFDPALADYHPIGEFAVGDVVLEYSRGKAREMRIVRIDSLGSDPTDVYNITVDIHHNYLVNGVLVHNVKQEYATGGAGLTNGPMNAVWGEAGTEAYAILRNPRPLPGGGVSAGGSGGGMTYVTLVLPGIGPIAKGVLNWADDHAHRSTTLRMMPGGSY